MGRKKNRPSRAAAEANLRKVRGRKWGYNTSQVDEFLSKAHRLYERAKPAMSQESVQISSFDLQKGGYRISDVDGALMRLQQAVSDKHTRWEVEYRGERGWMEETLGLALSLKPRALAPLCKRFDKGKRKTISYDRQQVDQVMDDSWYTICKHLSISPDTSLREPMDVDAIDVSDTVFTQRKGKRGYGEPSVDAYLNRVVQVLNRIESFKRLGYRMPDPSTVRPARRGFVEEVEAGGREEKEKVYLQAPAEHADLSSLVSKSEKESEQTLPSRISPPPSEDTPAQASPILPPALEAAPAPLYEPKKAAQRRRHAQSKSFLGFRRNSSSKGDEK